MARSTSRSGRWAEAARQLLQGATAPLIFVGGTGLYFRALTQGLSDIPLTPAPVRDAVRASAEGVETPDLHARLAGEDAATAARLRPSDRQRILRALEVIAATGKPLADHQGARLPAPLNDGEWRGLFLSPDRDWLYARIASRFAKMLELGALDEVEAMRQRNLDPALPVMRAHGAPHLIAHLEGRLTLAQAEVLSVADTKHYAKRQFTWARHQMPNFVWVAPEDAEAKGREALD